ncbi:MAG: peptidase M75, Imelysin [Alphaproteobacteria bacterium]|nr:peptidase M75, Imelysin [Alphaproteobacteria bacterium]
MKKLCSIPLLAALVVLVAVPAQADVPEVMAKAITDYIVPGYALLETEAGALGARMDALCAGPSPANLETARDQFADLVRAWARIDMIRFGPVSAENRLERVLFWPDRRSLALKQVQAALIERDETVLSLETLEGKSVGLQGLGSLEYVLFGTGSDEMAAQNDGFRCRYGGTIARNVAGIADTLHAAWSDPQGIAHRLIAPRPDNPDYRSADEVLREFLGLFSHGFERMRVQELTPVLADGPGSARSKSALFWRSGLSMDMLVWEAQGMGELLAVSGLGALLGENQRWIGDSFWFELANFVATGARLDAPIDQVLTDPDGWDKVSYLSILTSSLEQIFGAQIAGSLGVDLGFSALDGD